ncbi:hypothetical protein [Helicobacter sp. 13S00477-4]|uniref:hypothetical protein n=1 Tax=Helicobacter sp. 13S00477-4 TaxID=1905759 RepID=UPI000BA72C52|nr:hypothetical protein [Helicobacter sp. 13S00477-4]
MQNEEYMINDYGEIITKDSLIEEIQSLLNHLKSSQTTILNPNIMKSLDITNLNTIRDNLLKKSGNEIENNLEWLHSLKNKH